ncbi:MAG TPA: signal peptidase I [Halococcus sp.]|nr:signal peptidase I [Halococcus sp.]
MTQLISNRRRLLEVVGLAVLIAVLVPFVVFIAPQVVGAEHSYVVVSGSMTPAIGVGETVVVNDVPPAAIHDGDIITFRRGETAEIQQGQAGSNLVTHRVVEIVERGDGLAFRTKGDANEEPDQKLVPADALVGRVMFTIPYIGHAIVFAGTQLGFIALIVVPLGLLVLGELYDLARAARNSRADSTTTDTDERAETDGGTDTEQEETDESATSDEWRWGG